MAKKTTMILGTSAAGLALLAGLGFAGVASAADSSGSASDSAKSATESATIDETATTDRGKHGGRGGNRSAEIASGLAKKLGVDETKLSDALKTYREANQPTKRTEGTTTKSDRSTSDRSTSDEAMAKSLAKSLGIEESKVTTALAELRSEGRSERAAGLKSTLDKAVTDGKLTQAEADAVTKAVEQGLIDGR